MFRDSVKFANLLMVIAALALCVSACTTAPDAGLYAESAGSVAGLTSPVTAIVPN